VVDDEITDNTSEVAELADATVIRQDENKGYGAAIQSILQRQEREIQMSLFSLTPIPSTTSMRFPSLSNPSQKVLTLSSVPERLRNEELLFTAASGNRSLYVQPRPSQRRNSVIPNAASGPSRKSYIGTRDKGKWDGYIVTNDSSRRG